MTLLGLAGIIAASLLGPLLASSRRLRIPIVIGELAVGVVLGTTGLRWVHSDDRTLTFLAQAGFALVMLIAGTHVPVANRAMRSALDKGLVLALGIGVLAIPVAAALSAMAGTHHTALYAVLLASSSAAVVMPILAEDRIAGDRVLVLMAQVAIADTACIIALPLAADPGRAGRAAVGTVIVLAVAGLAFLILRELAERGLLVKLHRSSVRHTFGIEMRVSLAALFALAGLAVTVHVSVMLAGFAFGLVLAGIGTPRRLASQFFAVTEGFLGPVFLVWLGASIDLRALAHHPRLILLAVGLAAGSAVLHGLGRLLGQPISLALIATAQLGVPIAAVALGTHNSLLSPGEGGAILAAAILTLVVASVASGRALRWARSLRTRSHPAAAPDPAVTDSPVTDSPVPVPAVPEPAVPAVPVPAVPVPVEPVPVVPGPELAVPAQSDAAARPVARAGARAGARVAGEGSRAAARAAAAAGRDNSAISPANPAARAVREPTNVTTKAGPVSGPVQGRPPTPNPATKPIVQSNVRIQQPPHPKRPEPPESAEDRMRD